MATNRVFSDFVVRARDQFTGPMRNMQRSTTMFSRNAQRSLGGVSRSLDRMRRLTQIATGAILTGFVARGVRGLISAAADVERVTVQFETLTGSMENATQLVQDMQQFAATTPLQFDTLAQGTQRLLAFGIAQDDVLGTLQVLGDAALGDANKLDSLVRAYGKVTARGRASMEEINMVIDAGVPIMAALNEEFGTTTEELTAMISAGEVTSDVFTAAFRRMTSEGGQFHAGMQRQSQTTAGLFSTLKDNVQLTAASIGSALLPTTQELTRELIDISARMREWVDTNQELINQRVQDTVSSIANAGQAVGRGWQNGLIPAVLSGIAAFKIATVIVGAVQAGLVAFSAAAATAGTAGSALAGVVAVLGGPVTAIAAAIAAVVGLVVLLIKNWDKLSERFRNSNFGELSSGNNVGVDGGMERNAQRYGLIASPWQPAMYGAPAGASSVTENRSTVDVNFSNLPSSAIVRQWGTAPGFSLRNGYQAAGIHP